MGVNKSKTGTFVGHFRLNFTPVMELIISKLPVNSEL